MTSAPPAVPASRLAARGQVDCHPADLTFSACAAVRLTDLDERLRQHGQWFSVDGPGDGELGLMIERDSTGPLRLGFGGWRDLLLGVQFEDGRGRLISVGGRVMKNVAGYDLTKFMVGQRGVFGRVVTLTARTYKRPTAALAARFSSAVDIAALRPLPAWSIETRGGTWAGWLGDEPLVDFAARSLDSATGVQLIRQSLDDDRALRLRLWALPEGEEGVVLRASVPVGRVGALVVETRAREWVADPYHGVVLMKVGQDQIPLVRKAAWSAGGRAEAEGLAVMVSPQEAELLRRIKQQLDPDSALAPLELEVVS
jgi:FAD/FMN-containing dehydrogenase